MPTSPLTVETMLAAIGPAAILEAKPTLHKYQVEKAVEMPRQIRRRILAFLATDSFKAAREMAPFDYGETLDLLTKGPPEEQRTQALTGVVPDADLAAEVGMHANDIALWASATIPKPTLEGLPATEVEPDDVQKGDFARLWEVASDPMALIGDLEDGSLSDDQVATVAQHYPALHAEMKQAVSDGLGAMVARKGKEWAPSPTKAILVGLLRQEDPFDPQLFTMVQGVYASEQAQQAPAGGTPRSRKPSPSSEDINEGTKGQQQATGADT